MCATTQDRKQTEQKEGSKRNEHELSGEECEQGERRARKRTSGADRAL